MALFAIGDLHLSLGCDKPMDIFSGWQDYVQRLEAHWRRDVTPGDTVVLAGDTSWAMKLEDCRADFAFLQSLPGRKLLLKGNHDYWWTTRSKMERFAADCGFDSLHFIHNNAYLAGDLAIAGTRGWMFEQGEAHDAKMAAREAGRLEMSLAAAETQWPQAEALAFLHYPPLYAGLRADNMLQVLHRHGVRRCFYGHLHGLSIKKAAQGLVDGIDYTFISADALEFRPLAIN